MKYRRFHRAMLNDLEFLQLSTYARLQVFVCKL